MTNPYDGPVDAPPTPAPTSAPVRTAAEALEPLLEFLEGLDGARSPEPRVTRLCALWSESAPVRPHLDDPDTVHARLADLERGQSRQADRVEGLLRRLPDPDDLPPL